MAVKMIAVGAGLVATASGAFLGVHPKSHKNVEQMRAQWQEGNTIEAVRQMSMSDVDSTPEKEVEEMVDTIETLVSEGDDKTSKLAKEHLMKYMNELVVNTMIPNRLRAQAADQAQLDASVKKLKNCHIDRHVLRDMNVHAEVAAAEDHKEDYKDGLAEHGECLSVLDGKKMVKDAYCASVSDAKDVCANDQLKSLSVNQKCCDANAAYDKHKLTCQTGKSNAQYASKQHEIIMTKVCGNYYTCYDTQKKDYQVTEKSVKTAFDHRSWASLYRIKCLVGEYKKTKGLTAAASKACKTQKHDIKQIDYPEVPAKADCATEVDA